MFLNSAPANKRLRSNTNNIVRRTERMSDAPPPRNAQLSLQKTN